MRRAGRRRRWGGDLDRVRLRGLHCPASGQRSAARSAVRSAAVSMPLELPRREAPDVDVELVEPGVTAVVPELDLELHLVAGRGLFAGGACCANTWPAPRPIGLRLGSLPITTALRAFSRTIFSFGIWAFLARKPGARRQEDWVQPDAGGSDAKCVCRRPKGRHGKCSAGGRGSILVDLRSLGVQVRLGPIYTGELHSAP